MRGSVLVHGLYAARAHKNCAPRVCTLAKRGQYPLLIVSKKQRTFVIRFVFSTTGDVSVTTSF